MPDSPITGRAICVGLFMSILINLVMGYNDWYLGNTLLIGNHFPYVSITFLVLLVLGVNAGLRRIWPINPFSAGELILIWGMIGVAGGIGSAGLMRYFPSYMATPAYYANPTNEWADYVLKYLPDWMVLSRDPDSPAVTAFMEGLTRGQVIPWMQWLVPMVMWFGFMGLLYATNFSLISIFFTHWSLRERLIFPVVHLPALIAEKAPGKDLLNSFFKNRLTWIGFGIPLLIWGWNGMSSYYPGMPKIPMSWYSWGLFPDRPWSELHLLSVNIYFTVIGLTFLLTTEIAFSFWCFYVLYRASYVLVAWVGAGGGGFWGSWHQRITVFETAGCMLVIAGFLFWTARGALREWFRRAVAGRSDPETDPMAPRLALIILLVGILGMIGWFLLAGAQWWAAVIGVIMFLVVLLVLTRVVAESGLFFVQSNVIPYDLLTGLFPPAWLSGFTLVSMALQKGVHMFDLREIFMPYVINGLKAGAQVRMRMGRILAVFALTAAVAIVASVFAKVTLSHKYGGVNLDLGANVTFPNSFVGAAATFQKTPPTYDRVSLAETKLLPVNVVHMVLGAVLTAGMLFMRATFLWWPLHPFGLVMCGTWAMEMFWFSFLLGWACKSFFMTFMGASVYRRVLPLFLGLALGESIAAAFYAVMGLITGTPGISILPY